MVDRPHKPAALAATPGLPPQPRVDLMDENRRVRAELPSGESVDVLLHGATVISWKAADGVEKLWLSEAAKLDGSRSVRGGIPLVFPNFGPPPADGPCSGLPQHGFARNSRWEYLGRSTGESGFASVKLDFCLSSSQLDAVVREAWPHEFSLLFSVTLDPRTLTTALVVTNTGSEPLDFHMLFHTYLKIADLRRTAVTGLSGAGYIDKTDGMRAKTEAADEVAVEGETDRIYTPGHEEDLTAIVEDGTRTTTVSRYNLADQVMWNPGAALAASMADFAPDDAYLHMLCIEPGNVKEWTRLDCGDSFEGAQIITSL